VHSQQNIIPITLGENIIQQYITYHYHYYAISQFTHGAYSHSHPLPPPSPTRRLRGIRRVCDSGRNRPASWTRPRYAAPSILRDTERRPFSNSVRARSPLPPVPARGQTSAAVQQQLLLPPRRNRLRFLELNYLITYYCLFRNRLGGTYTRRTAAEPHYGNISPPDRRPPGHYRILPWTTEAERFRGSTACCSDPTRATSSAHDR